MIIEAPELQTEVRGFLEDTTKSYTEILEEIYAGYKAQTTGEDIRGVPGSSTTTSTLSRLTKVEKVNTKRETDVEKAWIYAPFLDNSG